MPDSIRDKSTVTHRQHAIENLVDNVNTSVENSSLTQQLYTSNNNNTHNNSFTLSLGLKSKSRQYVQLTR